MDGRAVRRTIGRASSAAAVAALSVVVVSAGAPAGATHPTTMSIDSEPTVVEGEIGDAVNLVFTVRLSNTTEVPVTGRFSTAPTSGFGSTPATEGTTCSAGVDYLNKDSAFTIPAFVTTIAISVVVCPDNANEGSNGEDLVAIVDDVENAQCFEGTCVEVGTIIDDDSAPVVSVSDVSTREPTSGSSSASFAVQLNHPHPDITVTVDLRTRDATARSSGPCGVVTNRVLPDYAARTTRFTFASGVTAATFTVPVCADSLNESSEEFFVDVVPVLNAVAGTPGRGTIFNAIRPMFTGTFTLAPDDVDVAVGTPVDLVLGWTVSEGVWRDLSTIDLRVARRPRGSTIVWVRWDEAANTLRLCSEPPDGGGGGEPRCGPAGSPGDAAVLEAPNAQLHLAGSTVTGSGPTGPSVELRLRVSFDDGAQGVHDVEVAASDDRGNHDDFVVAGTLGVARA